MTAREFEKLRRVEMFRRTGSLYHEDWADYQVRKIAEEFEKRTGCAIDLEGQAMRVDERMDCLG